jgi:hypothetical protein
MQDPSQQGGLALPHPHIRTSKELFTFNDMILDPVPSDSEGTVPSPEGVETQPDNLEEETPRKREWSWIGIPTAPAVLSNVASLWHYTDAQGVIGILLSSTLRAAPLFAMNDSAEYVHGRRVLDEVLEDVKVSRFINPRQKEYIFEVVKVADEMFTSSGLFALCASATADSLAQWRAYGGVTPHAVLIDPTQGLAVVSPDPMTHTTESASHVWRKILYTKDEQRDLLLDVLGFLAYMCPAHEFPQPMDLEELRSMAAMLVQALSFCKEASFSVENEVRMVLAAPGSRSIRFRAGRTGVMPYLELTSASTLGERTTVRATRLPVSHVGVGPFGSRDESASGVRMLLDSIGASSVGILVSSSTQR